MTKKGENCLYIQINYFLTWSKFQFFNGLVTFHYLPIQANSNKTSHKLGNKFFNVDIFLSRIKFPWFVRTRLQIEMATWYVKFYKGDNVGPWIISNRQVILGNYSVQISAPDLLINTGRQNTNLPVYTKLYGTWVCSSHKMYTIVCHSVKYYDRIENFFPLLYVTLQHKSKWSTQPCTSHRQGRTSSWTELF